VHLWSIDSRRKNPRSKFNLQHKLSLNSNLKLQSTASRSVARATLISLWLLRYLLVLIQSQYSTVVDSNRSHCGFHTAFCHACGVTIYRHWIHIGLYQCPNPTPDIFHLFAFTAGSRYIRESSRSLCPTFRAADVHLFVCVLK
jgi:hypothetical protein